MTPGAPSGEERCSGGACRAPSTAATHRPPTFHPSAQRLPTALTATTAPAHCPTAPLSTPQLSWPPCRRPAPAAGERRHLPLSAVNHISRVCRDVAATATFYSDLLGFIPVQRPQSLEEKFEGCWWVLRGRLLGAGCWAGGWVLDPAFVPYRRRPAVLC